jgi:hypothetical protein
MPAALASLASEAKRSAPAISPTSLAAYHRHEEAIEQLAEIADLAQTSLPKWVRSERVWTW